MRSADHSIDLRRIGIQLAMGASLCFALSPLWADSTSKLEFEVASVKVAPVWTPGTLPPVPTKDGGPGTERPTVVEFHNVPLRNLVRIAFGVADSQLSGPTWFTSDFFTADRYEITARIAAGSTQEDFRQMLESLLVDRFRLKYHRTKRRAPCFILGVARSGHRLTPAIPLRVEANAPPNVAQTSHSATAGSLVVKMRGERTHVRCAECSMSSLVDWLRSKLDAEVLDMTGLTGPYDIEFDFENRLDITSVANGERPDIGRALRSGLGLTLERRTELIDYIMIDGAERVPVEN